MLACFLGHSLHVVQHALFATPAEIMPLGTAILLIGGSSRPTAAGANAGADSHALASFVPFVKPWCPSCFSPHAGARALQHRTRGRVRRGPQLILWHSRPRLWRQHVMRSNTHAHARARALQHRTRGRVRSNTSHLKVELTSRRP